MENEAILCECAPRTRFLYGGKFYFRRLWYWRVDPDPYGLGCRTMPPHDTAAGYIQNFVSNPGLNGIDSNINTPYTICYNLSIKQQLANNLAATLSYVGNGARHLPLYYAPNTVRGLFAPGTNTPQYQPFPDFGGVGIIHFGGVSNYNSLQA